MLLVGLTGGIGSGKSTFARLLERRGAVVFDADELARRAVEPGSPGHRMVVERFGTAVLAADGGIDRDALAREAFRDEGARRDLEAIVHPEVFRLLAEGVEPHRRTDRIVVFDAPLVVETGFDRACDVVVLVTAPEEVRVRRLAESRGMTRESAHGRMAAQMPEAEKRARAHLVVDNDGSIDRLEREAGRVWAELRSRAGGGNGD